MPNSKITGIFIVDVDYYECLAASHDIRRARKNCNGKIIFLARTSDGYQSLVDEVHKETKDKYDAQLVHIWFVGFDDPFLHDLFERLAHPVRVLKGEKTCSLHAQVTQAIRKICPNWEMNANASEPEFNRQRVFWEQLNTAQKTDLVEKISIEKVFYDSFNALELDGKTVGETLPESIQEKARLVISERVFTTGRTIDSDSREPDLRLRLAKNNQDIAPWLIPCKNKNEYRLTLISESGTGTPGNAGLMALYVASPLKQADIVNELYASAKERALALGFEVQYLRRQESMFLAVNLPVGSALEACHKKYLDELADKILNSLLLGARPVPRWRSSFLTAFRDTDRAFFKQCIELSKSGHLKVDSNPRTGSRGDERKGYFLPELQGTLMPNGDPEKNDHKFWSFRLCDERVKNWRLSVCNGNYELPLEMQLESVKIHFNPGETFALEWTVEAGGKCEVPPAEDGSKLNPASCFQNANKILWRHYLLREAKDKSAWSLAKVIDFNAEARLNYFDYERLSTSKKQIAYLSRTALVNEDQSITAINKYTGDAELPEEGFPLGNINLTLLKVLFGEKLPAQRTVVQLTDSRSRIVTSVITDGGTPDSPKASDSFDALCAQLSSADPYGVDWPYDSEYSKSELQQAAYKRYWSWGSRFMIMDHCFAFLGFRHHHGLPAPQDGSEGEEIAARPEFAEDPIHALHMTGPYARLYRFFLAIEANLRNVAMRLTKLETDLPDHRAVPDNTTFEDLKDLRHELDRLSARFINAHVSSQVQGRDLARKMHQQFDIEKTWNELDERVCRAEAQWRAVRETNHNTRMTALYLLGTLSATLVGIYSLDPDAQNPQAKDRPLAWVWNLVECLSDNIATLVGQKVAMPLAFILAGLALWCLVMICVEAFGCFRTTSKKRGGQRRHYCLFAYFKNLWITLPTIIILALVIALLIPAL